jgi:hypothetical protein
MLPHLKNHPFAVEAFFEQSLVFTFAVPKAAVQALLPECLQPDLFKDEWAFVAVAMVQTKALRPKGFPKFMGNDFFLIGYRVFVRYRTAQGKNLRGLYILKSETDKKKMAFFGNLFTHYKYTTTDIRQVRENGFLNIHSEMSGFSVRVETGKRDNLPLPNGSPFADWKEARRFAGPLPFTFTYNKATREVLIIEGVREDWKPEPVVVSDYHFSFLESLGFGGAQLANAFILRNIPYWWKKGKLETWQTEGLFKAC